MLATVSLISLVVHPTTKKVEIDLTEFPPDFHITLSCKKHKDLNTKGYRLDVKRVSKDTIVVNYGFFRLLRGTTPVLCYN